MKIKIKLLLSIIVCFLNINNGYSQISFAGPTTTVPSGTVFTFTATGETATKYIGSVPYYGVLNTVIPGVTCPLVNTNYYGPNNPSGKFQYKLINDNSVAKTVDITFMDVLIVTKTGVKTEYNVQNITCRVTIGPTIITPIPSGPPEPPVAPGLVKVVGLFTSPSLTKPDVGFKLPEENLELKWDPSKLSSSTINITIYGVSSSSYEKEKYDYPGSITLQTVTVPNTGSYKPNFNGVLSFDIRNGYYAVIEDLAGNKYGRSGLFFFLNDHASLWGNAFPNSLPHAFWIFRPDSSGSGSGGFIVKWLADRINATNVSIDLYTSNGVFYKRLVNSAPNNGNFVLPNDSSVPLGNSYFYQYKITSVENPSQFGYSEVFNHWID